MQHHVAAASCAALQSGEEELDLLVQVCQALKAYGLLPQGAQQTLICKECCLLLECSLPSQNVLASETLQQQDVL